MSDHEESLVVAMVISQGAVQTSKAAASATARPQKPELHRTIEEAADGEAEEILYPISFQQRCKRTSSGCLLEIETDVPIYARMRLPLPDWMRASLPKAMNSTGSGK